MGESFKFFKISFIILSLIYVFIFGMEWLKSWKRAQTALGWAEGLKKNILGFK